jgi:hypothetical protein
VPCTPCAPLLLLLLRPLMLPWPLPPAAPVEPNTAGLLEAAASPSPKPPGPTPSAEAALSEGEGRAKEMLGECEWARAALIPGEGDMNELNVETGPGGEWLPRGERRSSVEEEEAMKGDIPLSKGFDRPCV